MRTKSLCECLAFSCDMTDTAIYYCGSKPTVRDAGGVPLRTVKVELKSGDARSREKGCKVGHVACLPVRKVSKERTVSAGIKNERKG